MNDNNKETTNISTGDLKAFVQAVRETHAALRLITANSFSGFIDLSRTEQRHALQAALTLSLTASDLADSVIETDNPDKG